MRISFFVVRFFFKSTSKCLMLHRLAYKGPTSGQEKNIHAKSRIQEVFSGQKFLLHKAKDEAVRLLDLALLK